MTDEKALKISAELEVVAKRVLEIAEEYQIPPKSIISIAATRDMGYTNVSFEDVNTVIIEGCETRTERMKSQGILPRRLDRSSIDKENCPPSGNSDGQG